MAVALNDKAAADAAKELATALKERDTAYRVEVLRARNNGDDEDENEETIVYASALFEDGKYLPNNPNLWSIDLRQDDTFVCRLADLRDCHVCVGGGFPVASLDDQLPYTAGFQAFFDSDALSGDQEGDEIKVSFCFCPHSIWLRVLIHGWPREEWEAVIRDDNVGPDDTMEFLVDTVATQYPDATVECSDMCFVAKSIHGALKRLLPPKRVKDVRAEREKHRSNKDPEYEALWEFVAQTMRDQGNDANRALFRSQIYAIIGFLGGMGVERLGENDELINQTILTHSAVGETGLREIFDIFHSTAEGYNPFTVEQAMVQVLQNQNNSLRAQYLMAREEGESASDETSESEGDESESAE